jgi:hypothetical protein
MILLCTQELTSQELEAINQCRLYLKAYYISDVTTASGKRLSFHAWEGVPRDNGTTNRLCWPNQGAPSKSAWDIWRKTLKRNIISRGLRIKQDIGEWLYQNHDIWPWYYSPSIDGLIHIVPPDIFHLHNRSVPTKISNSFMKIGTRIEQLPSNLHKASVR